MGDKRWVGINPKNPEEVYEKVDTMLHSWLIWMAASLAVLIMGILILTNTMREPTLGELLSHF